MIGLLKYYSNIETFSAFIAGFFQKPKMPEVSGTAGWGKPRMDPKYPRKIINFQKNEVSCINFSKNSSNKQEFSYAMKLEADPSYIGEFLRFDFLPAWYLIEMRLPASLPSLKSGMSWMWANQSKNQNQMRSLLQQFNRMLRRFYLFFEN